MIENRKNSDESYQNSPLGARGHIIITNHTELLLQIEELRYLKNIQEDKLKQTFSELGNVINLVSMIKGESNNNSQNDLLKTGVNMAVDLVIDLTLGKFRSVKGFLSSVMVEKFTTLLINNNLGNMISGITQLIHKKKKQEII